MTLLRAVQPPPEPSRPAPIASPKPLPAIVLFRTRTVSLPTPETWIPWAPLKITTSLATSTSIAPSTTTPVRLLPSRDDETVAGPCPLTCTPMPNSSTTRAVAARLAAPVASRPAVSVSRPGPTRCSAEMTTPA